VSTDRKAPAGEAAAGTGQERRPELPRRTLPRRTLLSAGGITILAGCAAPVARVAGTTQANPARTGSPKTEAPPKSATAHSPGQPAPGGKPAKHAPGHRAVADEPVFYVDDGPRAIALTIDDGPDAVYTPQVLRLLARYRVTAMFSMIGIEVRGLPEMAREVADAGHVIANHTWRHLDLGTLRPAAVAAEMDQATDAIQAATGIVPGRFRAPYGVWSEVVFERCAAAGMTPVDWSVDPRDWARPGVRAIVRDIMATTRGGSIILEHDGGGNRSQTVAALGIVIPRLLDAGYHFVTPQ
jgi:peptidoglycan-N-acetylglucosamine deacetylase